MKLVNALIVLVGSFLIAIGLFAGRANAEINHSGFNLEASDWTIIGVGSLAIALSIGIHINETRRPKRHQYTWSRGQTPGKRY